MRRNIVWYFKISAVIIWFIVATALYFFLILPKGKNPKNNVGYVKFVGPIGRRILGLNYILRMNPQAKDLAQATTPAVYIMNHQSALDVLSNYNFYPENCIVIVKKALMSVPFFGWIVALGDNISLERQNPKQSMARMKEAREAMELKKRSVWIFPEGTRKNTGELHRFKHGAFHLAVQTGAPIIPVITSSYCKNIDFNRTLSGTVIVEVLEPIETTLYSSSQIETLVEKCHKVMAEALSKNSLEAASTHQVKCAPEKAALKSEVHH
jgi:1-acyl-sn-glycerol-3-phosphate acyltransferase